MLFVSDINTNTDKILSLSESEDDFICSLQRFFDGYKYSSIRESNCVFRDCAEDIAQASAVISSKRLEELLKHIYKMWMTTEFSEDVDRLIYDCQIVAFEKSFEDYSDFSEEKYLVWRDRIVDAAKKANIDYKEDVDYILRDSQISLCGVNDAFGEERMCIDTIREMFGLELLYGYLR